ncbi:MAG TPA: ATP-binding protein [Thermoanaerobaculia bacterium]|jgi:hypothetical protein|nr:ATP-binding protein [Thermoanaerobaculia bacterium]
MTSPDPRRNWFMPRVTVRGDHFFGRDNELYHLKERLRSGQSVLVVGERRIGKTSLLAEGYRRLARSSQEYHLHLDAQSFSTGGRLLASLAEYLKDKEWPDSRVNQSHHHVNSDALIAALSRATSRDRQLTLFINDLDDLLIRSPEIEDGRHIVSFLRSIVENGHIVVCAVAFQAIVMEPPTAMHAPLFNVFYPMTLRTFNEQDAWHLLTTNSERSGKKLTEQECHFIMEIAGRKPYHLQELGYGLFESGFSSESANDYRPIFLEDAANQFAWTMQEQWGHTLKHLSAQQLMALVSALKGEPTNDPGSYSYLIKRGLLDEGDSQFTSMGTLFHTFVLEQHIETQGEEVKGVLSSTIKGVAESAMRAAVAAAVKAILL